MSPISRRNLIISATASAALIGTALPASARASSVLPSSVLPGTVLPVAGAAASAAADAAAPSSVPTHPAPLTFEASSVRVIGDVGPRSIGATITTVGNLHDKLAGPITGSFYSSGTILELPQRYDNGHSVFETQVLSFDGDAPASGTITGSGLVRHDGSGNYTITGGTGRFSGASGAYSTVLHPNTGGRGTGIFVITLN